MAAVPIERPRGPLTVEWLRRVCEAEGFHVSPLGEVGVEACADLVALSPRTLANMRSRAAGPHWTYTGRVRYALRDIAEWLNARHSRDW